MTLADVNAGLLVEFEAKNSSTVKNACFVFGGLSSMLAVAKKSSNFVIGRWLIHVICGWGWRRNTMKYNQCSISFLYSFGIISSNKFTFVSFYGRNARVAPNDLIFGVGWNFRRELKLMIWQFFLIGFSNCSYFLFLLCILFASSTCTEDLNYF